MADLDLSEDQFQFNSALEGYGAEIYGGTAEERELAVRAEFDGNPVIIDCREIHSIDDFKHRMAAELDISLEECDEWHLKPAREAFNRDNRGMIFLEFDSMAPEVQTYVARAMKNAAEKHGTKGGIVYTCESKGAVVRADFDLAPLIKSFGLVE